MEVRSLISYARKISQENTQTRTLQNDHENSTVDHNEESAPTRSSAEDLRSASGVWYNEDGEYALEPVPPDLNSEIQALYFLADSPTEQSHIDINPEEDNVTENATEIDEALNHFQRLDIRRMDLLRLRLLVRERRKELRGQRDETNDVNSKLMEQLQKSSVQDVNFQRSSINNAIDNSLVAHEELKKAEEAYDTLEDELIQEEWELKTLENEIYNSLQHNLLGQKFMPGSASPSSSNRSLSAQQAYIPPILQHLTNAYMSRTGDADLVKEQLTELRVERAHLVEEQRTRNRIGLDLNDEGQNFLKNFDLRHEELIADLQHIEEDLNRIMQMRADHDDVLFRLESTNSLADKSELLSEDIFENASSPQHPIMRTPEEIEDHYSDLVKLCASTTTELMFMALFVNRWLLNMLRGSRIQFMILNSVFADYEISPDASEIKDKLLDFWNKDKAAPDKIRLRYTPTTAQSVRRSNLPDTARSTRSDSAYPLFTNFAYRFKRDGYLANNFAAHSDKVSQGKLSIRHWELRKRRSSIF